ncbi:hypothetical protein [Streptomyces atratus]|uniref:hypothetical protein n=1 Tax=Streptomyces atratus TaxID=1893 RepID=UPI001300A22F|nr:hypothetical protein [Streptomyces atratus]
MCPLSSISTSDPTGEEVFVRGELDSERTPSHWPEYVIVDGDLVIGGALGWRKGDG